MLLLSGVVKAREYSVQLRETNNLDWNVVKSRMLLFYGAIKVREISVHVSCDLLHTHGMVFEADVTT